MMEYHTSRKLFRQKRRYTLKNAELFQPKFGSNIGKPSNWVNIFNNRFGFVHILPQIGLKQLSIL